MDLCEEDLTYLLSLKLFAAITHWHYLGALGGFHGLLLVLRQIALAWANGDPVDPDGDKDSDWIGDDIPPITFQTVDLVYSGRAQREHDKAYTREQPKLK
ncbi:hypothetical protein BJX64DRAFT_291744 [Aspergillus heterothallicus]